MTATSGRIGGDELDELLAGARLAENLDSVLREKPREPLPDDDGVVGEDHAHGMTAVTRVPTSELLSTSQVAVERLDAVTETTEPGSLRIGSADTVVGDLDRDPTVRAGEGDRGPGCVRVFGDVRERLARDEVGRGLDRLGQTPGRDGQLDRDRGAPREGGDGRRKAFVGEDRRMDAARERAQLLEGADRPRRPPR